MEALRERVQDDSATTWKRAALFRDTCEGMHDPLFFMSLHEKYRVPGLDQLREKRLEHGQWIAGRLVHRSRP
jgi:hypothetical protein